MLQNMKYNGFDLKNDYILKLDLTIDTAEGCTINGRERKLTGENNPLTKAQGYYTHFTAL